MTPPIRCLWIAREIPFPENMGDRIYTGRLSRSLAQAGAEVELVGLQPLEGPVAASGEPVRWVEVPGRKRSMSVAAATSLLPVAAAIHATEAFGETIDAALRRPWDAIVFDQLGATWALERVRRLLRGRADRPALIYLSHNHERSLWETMAATATGSPLRRLGLWQNAMKTAHLERRAVRGVDLVTTITAEDANVFAARDGARRTLVLTPGFGGWRAPMRTIDAGLPRRVVMLGSFRWAIKQENMRQFLAIADPIFAANGIELHVIGEMSPALAEGFRASTRATVFHGYVDDVAALFGSARLAVVPEVIGGGFKLKFLDYLFGRLPVASLTDAAAGLPSALRETMVLRDDLPALAAAIVEAIDRPADLDARQRLAFDMVEREYRWEDRGARLLGEIRALSCAPLACAA